VQLFVLGLRLLAIIEPATAHWSIGFGEIPADTCRLAPLAAIVLASMASKIRPVAEVRFW